MLRRVLGIVGIVAGVAGLWAISQGRWVEPSTRDVPIFGAVIMLGWMLSSGVVRLVQVFSKKHVAWLAVTAIVLYIVMIMTAAFTHTDGKIEWSWWQNLLGILFAYGWPLLDVYELISSEMKKKSVGMEVKDAGR